MQTSERPRNRGGGERAEHPTVEVVSIDRGASCVVRKVGIACEAPVVLKALGLLNQGTLQHSGLSPSSKGQSQVGRSVKGSGFMSRECPPESDDFVEDVFIPEVVAQPIASEDKDGVWAYGKGDNLCHSPSEEPMSALAEGVDGKAVRRERLWNIHGSVQHVARSEGREGGIEGYTPWLKKQRHATIERKDRNLGTSPELCGEEDGGRKVWASSELHVARNGWEISREGSGIQSVWWAKTHSQVKNDCPVFGRTVLYDPNNSWARDVHLASTLDAAGSPLDTAVEHQLAGAVGWRYRWTLQREMQRGAGGTMGSERNGHWQRSPLALSTCRVGVGSIRIDRALAPMPSPEQAADPCWVQAGAGPPTVT
ncbi:hypothetical protein FPV67DRAFT_1735418 [Lyophyllum atratum]|nr:hypothetical protein FPV67DRAFT_1735418 [Lyophyllum atratum]